MANKDTLLTITVARQTVSSVDHDGPWLSVVGRPSLLYGLGLALAPTDPFAQPPVVYSYAAEMDSLAEGQGLVARFFLC